jgi:protein disulfide-isomerase
VLIAIALLLMLLRATLTPPDDRVRWIAFTNEATAARISVDAGKPILYYVSASWCAPCRDLKAQVFAKEEHARYIGENFVPVQVVDKSFAFRIGNTLETQAFLDRLKIYSLPALIVARPDGTAGAATSSIVTLHGYPGPGTVRQFLNKALLTANRR